MDRALIEAHASIRLQIALTIFPVLLEYFSNLVLKADVPCAWPMGSDLEAVQLSIAHRRIKRNLKRLYIVCSIGSGLFFFK